jgi:hypothetical protein
MYYLYKRLFEANTRSKKVLRARGSGNNLIQHILFALEENAIHLCYKPADLVRWTTLIDLDLPQASLIGIASKRKKILTYTQETTRAKHEWLCSARLILHDQTTTTRHAKALSKANELISILAPTLSTISMILAILSD